MLEQKLLTVRRYSGVAGIIVLWSFITLGMHRTGLGLIDSRPISYLGVDPRSAFLFSGGLLASAFLFTVFAFYIHSTYRTNRKFLFYFIIGQAGQIIAAIVPYSQDSPYRTTHTVAAFTLAFSLPLLIREFARSQKRDDRHQIYRGLLRFEQITFVLGIGLFVFTSGIAPLGEALPTVGFHLWIIVVTIYTGSKP